MVQHSSRRTRRVGALSVVALIAGLLALLNPISGAGAATTSHPFTCSSSTVFIAQGVSPTSTQLYKLVAGSGSSTFSTVGSPSTQAYNAIAFNPADNFIYATKGLDIARIDANGVITTLGPAHFGANNGAIAGGVYYAAQSGTNVLHRVDLSTVVDSPITLSAPLGSADFTFIGGQLWGDGGGAGKLTRVDPTTGTVSVFSSPLPASLAAGAAWTYGNGNLGLSDNATGHIFQVQITNPTSASPTFTVIATSNGPASAFSNDGTACTSGPADLAIGKTVNPTVVNPGGPITWTITVTNNGPGTSSGYVVTDHIPSSVTGLSTTSPGCSVSGNTLLCVEGALASGSSAVFTVTGTAPTSGSVTNDATVLGNEVDPNLTNNHASATSFGVTGSCEARAVGQPLGINIGVANPSVTPCVTQDASVIQLPKTPFGPIPPLPSMANVIAASVLTSHTLSGPGSAHADAGAAGVGINIPALGISIAATGVQTQANASTDCVSAPTVTSSSTIATLMVNGHAVAVGSTPITIPLLVGTLYVNQIVPGPGSVVRRGLFLDLPGTQLDIIVAESTAGVSCS